VARKDTHDEIPTRTPRLAPNTDDRSFSTVTHVLEGLPRLSRSPSGLGLADLVVAHLARAGGDRPQDLLVNSVLTITAEAQIRIDPLP